MWALRPCSQHLSSFDDTMSGGSVQQWPAFDVMRALLRDVAVNVDNRVRPSPEETGKKKRLVATKVGASFDEVKQLVEARAGERTVIIDRVRFLELTRKCASRQREPIRQCLDNAR